MLVHDLIMNRATIAHSDDAILFKDECLSHEDVFASVKRVGDSLVGQGLGAGERVAVYLPKQPETVVSIFGTSSAGGVFVPVNPLLKPFQVTYILKDCNVRILITSMQRLMLLSEHLRDCEDLYLVILVENEVPDDISLSGIRVIGWKELIDTPPSSRHSRIDADIAAILYTSGSTGNPKGVVLSHRNMIAGAESVSSYLDNRSDDRLLAVLPFSFDYGLSQLTTAFLTGASVALMDYLLPRDILKALVKYRITGLAGVPPIWNQLIQLEWPEEIEHTLRYITNSGGAMPVATTTRFQELLPKTDIFLMYGLTEAFRSTYLPPDQISIRPESIGKAIPNAEIMVVRADGSECEPEEPGELVHRGSLVSLGYWNNPAKTAERFKPAPNRDSGLPMIEMAVWSGDQVKRDKEGYLYFISRKDEMIKTSGYRVSPTEVEEVAYRYPGVKEVAAIGTPHPALGQAILLVILGEDHLVEVDILNHCVKTLPSFMVPSAVILRSDIPRNPNGKLDRRALHQEYDEWFSNDGV